MSAVITKPSTTPSLTIKRRFKTPPAQVYAAWTDPEKMIRWMGPVNVLRVEAECDLRVGGHYHIKMVVPDDQHDVSGVYREVVLERNNAAVQCRGRVSINPSP